MQTLNPEEDYFKPKAKTPNYANVIRDQSDEETPTYSKS